MTTIKTRFDEDGDKVIFIEVDEYTVFATEDLNSFSLSFGLSKEVIEEGDWMETLTGLGAFKTIRLLRDAFSKLIEAIEKENKEWYVCSCNRRAKLYSRYISKKKIKITN